MERVMVRSLNRVQVRQWLHSNTYICLFSEIVSVLSYALQSCKYHCKGAQKVPKTYRKRLHFQKQLVILHTQAGTPVRVPLKLNSTQFAHIETAANKHH